MSKRTERTDYLAAVELAVSAQLAANRELTPAERRSTAGVLHYAQRLASYSGDDGHDVWPGNDELAATMGRHRRTVQRYRERLEKLGAGSHTPRKDGPRHNRSHLSHLRPTFGPALEYWTARRAQNVAKGERTKAERAADRRAAGIVSLVAGALAGEPEPVELPSGSCPVCLLPVGHLLGCTQALRPPGHDPP